MVKSCDTCVFRMSNGKERVCASKFYDVPIEQLKKEHSEIFKDGCSSWELSFSVFIGDPEKYEKYLKA